MPRSRKPSKQKLANEGYFHIRVRVKVPEEGFGLDMERIAAWMDERAGREGWGRCADTQACHEDDATAIYFNDPTLLVPLIEEFGLEFPKVDTRLSGQGSFIPVRGPWGK